MAPSAEYAAQGRAHCEGGQRCFLIPELVTLWDDNYRACGFRKLWKAAHRAGIAIGRDQNGRLSCRIEGATRSTRV